MLHAFFLVAGVTLGSLLLLAGILHTIPKLGATGRRISDVICRAPTLDIPITLFTVAPMIVGPIFKGWPGFFGGLVGQIATVHVWCWLHAAANWKHLSGPRIVKTSDRIAGTLRNRIATWATAIVTPLFWFIRLGEIFVYPILVSTVRFPPYKAGEWINCSRQKFEGLVGHDLIWCLYCDWMTGVWSLGSEMLRNVESFWCPIRFRSDKKCANCSTDFPDVAHGWVAPTATMSDVVETLEKYYGSNQQPRAWFGHPVRITVNGKSVAEPARETVRV